MQKPLTLELTLPLSQPLALYDVEEPECEAMYEPAVREVALDAQPLKADVRSELPPAV